LCFKTSKLPADAGAGLAAGRGKGVGTAGGAGAVGRTPGKSTSASTSIRSSEEAGSGTECASGMETFKAAFGVGPAENIGWAKSGLSSDTTSKAAGSGVEAPDPGLGISPASSLFSQDPHIGFIWSSSPKQSTQKYR